MPNLFNKRTHGTPPGAVYIGRPSVWGNPFEIGRDGSREQVVYKHRKWLCDNPRLLSRLAELEGKDLVCWCHPLACHGNTLLEMANPRRSTPTAPNNNTIQRRVAVMAAYQQWQAYMPEFRLDKTAEPVVMVKVGTPGTQKQCTDALWGQVCSVWNSTANKERVELMRRCEIREV